MWYGKETLSQLVRIHVSSHIHKGNRQHRTSYTKFRNYLLYVQTITWQLWFLINRYILCKTCGVWRQVQWVLHCWPSMNEQPHMVVFICKTWKPSHSLLCSLDLAFLFPLESAENITLLSKKAVKQNWGKKALENEKRCFFQTPFLPPLFFGFAFSHSLCLSGK